MCYFHPSAAVPGLCLQLDFDTHIMRLASWQHLHLLVGNSFRSDMGNFLENHDQTRFMCEYFDPRAYE